MAEPDTEPTQIVVEERPVFASVGSQWKWVVGSAAIMLAASLLYTFLAIPVWEAKATIVFPPRTPSFLGALGGDASGSVAASLLGGPTPLRVFAGILESERTLGYVSQHTQLSKKEIRRMRDITDQSTESSLSVTARGRNKAQALQVVKLHLDALRQINASLTEPLFSDDVSVLRQELLKQRQRVTAAEKNLVAFQSRSITAPTVAPTGSGREAGILALPGTWMQQLRQLEIEKMGIDTSLQAAQARARRLAGVPAEIPSDLPPLVKWRERLTELQYQLKLKEIRLSSSSPEVQKLRQEIAVTREKLQQEVQSYVKGVAIEAIDPSGAIDPANPLAPVPRLLTDRLVKETQIAAVSRLAKLAPNESVELSRLTRELLTQSSILQVLQTQTQLAAVQASRSPNRWEVLDEPQLAEEPTNKSYLMNGLVGLILGMLLGSMIALVRAERQRRGYRMIAV